MDKVEEMLVSSPPQHGGELLSEGIPLISIYIVS